MPICVGEAKLSGVAGKNNNQTTAWQVGGAGGPVGWLQQVHPELGPFLSTVLLLMAELARGGASPLQPWLALLPQEHDCLLAWSAEERTALAGKRCWGSQPDYQSFC